MARRLTDLIDWDVRSRWRIITYSIVFAAGCGFFAERGVSRIAVAQIYVAFAAVAFTVARCFSYIRNPLHTRTRKAGLSRSFSADLFGALKPALCFGALLLVLSASSPSISAAILSARLRSILAEPKTAASAAKADHILRLAATSHTTIRPSLQAEAETEASRLKSPEVWKQYLATLDAQMHLNSSRSQLGTGGTFYLDNLSVTNSAFSGVILSYRGGPLKLDHVCFNNDHFEIADTLNGRELAQAILSSGDNCISIVLK